MGARAISPARRRPLAAALVAVLAVALGAGDAAAQSGATAMQSGAVTAQSEIVVVSRERILHEAMAARRLRGAEAELTERLRGQIDATKAALAAEEEELARIRGELAEADFEARVADFDRRVRQARRVAQERAAILQKGFQDARAAIIAALPTLLERLRVEAGASIVLDADQVLAMDGALDLTDRAIALFDAEGPQPPLPLIDLSAPLLAPGAADPAPPEAAPDPAGEGAPPAR